MSNHGGEASVPLQNTPTPRLLLTYHDLYIKGYGNHIRNGSHDYRGPANAQGSKAKPTRRVRASQNDQSEG
jgi:hypothetical protein